MRWHDDCRTAYTEEEITAAKKTSQAAKKRRYYEKKQEEIRQKQNQYNQEHREEIKLRQRIYDQEHQEEKKLKQRIYDQDHREEKAEKQKLYRIQKKPQTADERIRSFKASMAGGLCRVCASCHRRMFREQVYNLSAENQQHLLDWCRVFSLKHRTHMCKSCYPFFKRFVETTNYWRSIGHARPEAAPRHDELIVPEERIKYEAWAQKRYEGTEYADTVNFWIDLYDNKGYNPLKATEVNPGIFRCAQVTAAAKHEMAVAKERAGYLPEEQIPQVDGEVSKETNIEEWFKLSPQEVIKKAWGEGMQQEILQIYRRMKFLEQESGADGSDDQACQDEPVIDEENDVPESDQEVESTDHESLDEDGEPRFLYDGHSTKGLFLLQGDELIDLSNVRNMIDLEYACGTIQPETESECECGETDCGCEEAMLACGSDLPGSDLYNNNQISNEVD